MPNFNTDTGIAFGFISASALDSDVVHTLLYGWGSVNISERERREEFIAHWIRENEDEFEDKDEAYELAHEVYVDVGAYVDESMDLIEGELDGVKYRSTLFGEALHFWIFDSPYVTNKGGKASPCVPGACILDDLDGDETGYDVPEHWRLKGN